MATTDELAEGQLRLLAARERAGGLEDLVAEVRPNMPRRPRRLGSPRGRSDEARTWSRRVRLGSMPSCSCVRSSRSTPRNSPGRSSPWSASVTPARTRSRLVLARAVEAHHDQPLLAPTDVEVEVVEHDVVAVGLGQIADLEHGSAGPRRLGEAHLHRAPVGRAVHRRFGLDALDALLRRLWAIEALDALAPNRSDLGLQAIDLLRLRRGELRLAAPRPEACARVRYCEVGALVLRPSSPTSSWPPRSRWSYDG